MNFLNKKRTTFIGAILAGIFYAMGFPSQFLFSQIITPHLALFFLLSFIFTHDQNDQNDQKSFWFKIALCICFSFGFFLYGLPWIPYTIKEFGFIPSPWNTVLGMLFSLFLLPHLYLFAFFEHYCKKKLPQYLQQNAFFWAFLFTLCEYLTPQQFPAHIGHTWGHLAPYIGLAPILGQIFFTYISAQFLLNIIFYFFTATKTKSHLIFSLGLTLSFFLLNCVLKIDSTPWTNQQNSNTITVRLVQANVGNFLKLSAEAGHAQSLHSIYQDYFQLSTKRSEPKPDLILWPETAFPKLMDSLQLKGNFSLTPKLIKDVLSNTSTPLFMGGYDYAQDDDGIGFESEYNTAFYFTPGQLNQVYHKRKLIPFGEGMPFGPLNHFLGTYIKSVSFFASGTDNPLFTLNVREKQYHFLSMICYEGLFSHFMQQSLVEHDRENRPVDFFANLTNDSWYGDSSEPYQHLFLTKWRAIELARPIIRMTNTGISSILLPDGSESQRIKLFEKRALDLQLTLPSQPPRTFYGRWGEITALLLEGLIICCSLILFPGLRRRKSLL